MSPCRHYHIMTHTHENAFPTQCMPPSAMARSFSDSSFLNI